MGYMIDTTHTYVANIPTSAQRVAGYTTGTADVQWTPQDGARFPHSGRVRIDQGYTWPPNLHSYDVLDIQNLAVTVAEATGAVHDRIAANIKQTDIYGTNSTLAQVEQALIAGGPHGWYYGHVRAWLADWDLSEQEAAALLGKEIHSLTCAAVQWASPSSNPDTPVPGSSLTLKQANVDLSVTLDSWFPPPPRQLVEITVTARYSDDTTKTWTMT